MKTLNPVILRELIEKIEVYQIEGTGKNRTQRVVIHYRFVGCPQIPEWYMGSIINVGVAQQKVNKK